MSSADLGILHLPHFSAGLSAVTEAARKETAYRADIDGLRALAVLAVVAYHAGFPGLQGGFVGVDVFFVISGFLITRLLAQEWKKAERISFLEFYARRVRRLMPVLWLVLGVTVLLVWLWVPGMGNTRNFSGSLRWAALGFANVFFKKNTGGYFDGATVEMPLLHLWSLGVEEQFYLLWPALLATLFWIEQRFVSARKRDVSTPHFGAMVFLALSGVGSFYFSEQALTHGQAASAFYLMPYRAWELGFGALLALGMDHAQFLNPRTLGLKVRNAISVFGVALIAWAFVTTKEGGHFPGSGALIPVLGTLLLLASGEGRGQGWVSRFLTRSFFLRVGRVSYGWYLWHWPLFVFARIWNWGSEPSLPVRILCVGLSYGLAELSLKFWEDPVRFRRWGRGLSSRGWVALGFLGAAIFGSLSVSVSHVEARVLSWRLGKELHEKIQETSSLGGRCFRLDEVGNPHCTRDFSPPKGVSAAKSPQAVADIAVWGDSHSCSAFPMIEAFARLEGLRATQYCLGQSLPLVSSDALDVQTYSGRVVQDLQARIQKDPLRPVSVILAARWVSYLGVKPLSQSTARFPALASTPDASAEILRVRVGETLDRLRRVGVKRVLILLPSPEFRASTMRCLLHPIEPCEVSREDQEAYRALAVRSLKQAAEGRRDVRWLDPVDVQCNSEKCLQVLSDGTPLVSDENHPTPAAARRLGQESLPVLQWLSGRNE